MTNAPYHHQNQINQSRHQDSAEYTVALVCVAGIFCFQLFGSLRVTETAQKFSAHCEKSEAFSSQNMRCGVAVIKMPS
jgi:hypothetical protein